MLKAYFSHSWKAPHLALNLAIWERMAPHCQLLIDQPVQELGDSSPPWYISRIESLLRRSDVFVACIPPAAACADRKGRGDWRLKCSPYMLFELRLAERANLPRFVVYDRETLLRPPPSHGSHARYVPCRMSEVVARCERGVEDPAIVSAFDDWLSWLGRNARPKLDEELLDWGLLVGDDKRGRAAEAAIRAAAEDAGFAEPVDLQSWNSDAELCGVVRTLSMLVADVSCEAILPACHLAHGLMTPTVRLWTAGNDAALPPILHGHPAGYQEDVIAGASGAELTSEVAARARALVRNVTPIVDRAEGRYELHQRLYKRHRIFVSHNLKGDDRATIVGILEAFRQRGIDYWEYEERNRSGDNWREQLQAALAAMTHFLPILSPTYEISEMCDMELKYALERGVNGVVFRPFLFGDRTSPNPHVRKLESMHHQRLPLDRSPAEVGETVVQSVLESIRR